MVASPGNRSFTLVEMVVSMAVFAIILVMVSQIISETELAWKRSSANIQAFQGARVAFDSMYRTLSEATLNTYYDYYEYTNSQYVAYTTYAATNTTATNTFLAAAYGRNSQLHFISGKALVTSPRSQVTQSVFFQTPASYTTNSASYGNMNSLLNAVGFYVDFNSDQSSWPTFFSSLTIQPAARYRYRLMEMVQPTEQLSVYSSSTGTAWFTTPLSSSSPPVEVLAENIVACVVCPHVSGEMTPTSPSPGTTLTTNYEYDSRMGATSSTSGWTTGSQPTNMAALPPLVRLVLIAADEPSMLQLQGSSTSQPTLGFSYANVFQNPANLTTDISTVTSALSAKHVNYHVFETDVPIRSANWSQSTN